MIFKYTFYTFKNRFLSPCKIIIICWICCINALCALLPLGSNFNVGLGFGFGVGFPEPKLKKMKTTMRKMASFISSVDWLVNWDWILFISCFNYQISLFLEIWMKISSFVNLKISQEQKSILIRVELPFIRAYI